MSVERYSERLRSDRWDDLRFPAQSINPAGAINAATIIDVETTFPGCLSFSGSADNMVAGVAQMPHAWNRGTAVRPHIHWIKPTGSSAAVTWQLYYRRADVGQTFEGWQGPLTGTTVAGDPGISNQQLITTFGALDMTGYEESVILAWRLYRRGSTDAENNAVTLLEFDIHYRTDKAGTVNEIPD